MAKELAGRVREPKYCQQCGEPLSCVRALDKYVCQNGHSTYLNQTSVGVAILPTRRKGVALIRRGAEPGLGELALIGGNTGVIGDVYAELAREVLEEVGLVVESDIRFWRSLSPASATGNLKTLIFLAYQLPISDDFAWQPNPREVQSVEVHYKLPAMEEFAFPLHFNALREYLESR